MDTNDHHNHMAENNSTKVIHKMGSTVLDSFSKLAHDIDNERIDAAIILLRHLLRNDSDLSNSKEVQYALTRLVRGMGTSRIPARKGFFTALTTYLSMNTGNDVSRILQLVNSELHSVGSNSKSEEADIYTGQILVCGALIHSKVLLSSTLEEQQKVLTLLITAGKKRSYLSCACYSFIIDFIQQLEEKDFKTIIWPILKTELAKPWKEQTLDTLHALLIIDDKYPALLRKKFIKKYLGSEEIIDEQSLIPISSVLMGLPMLLALKNPVYKLFSEKLAATDHVTTFWNIIEQQLASPVRNRMLVAIEVATFIVSNIKDSTAIPSLITQNFLQNVLRNVEINRRKPNDEVVIKFRKFLDLLVVTMKREDVQPKTQIALLKKLLLYPGDLLIEKKTGTKIILMLTLSLNLEGVKKLSKIYKDITAAIKPKEKPDGNEVWTNVERIQAAQSLTRLMSHTAVIAEHDWRLEHMKFLFKLGLCQSPAVGIELAASLKESFYRTLDTKFPKLNDLRNILSSLVHYLDAEIFSDKKVELRAPFSEEAKNVWKEMMALIEKLENNPKNKQAVPIFHTMELHMGLQLFSEPEMAISSIKDLHSCFERIERKKKNKSEDEPEWVEVVVDLILSLLSRGSHLLRSLVGCVFPHICPILTANSIHQILDILNPKKTKSPLSSRKDEDSSSEDEGEEEEEEEDEEEGTENGDDDEEDDEKVRSSDDGEDISDSDPDDDSFSEEDETVNDKLRMAVRQALGDAMALTDDEDVDVDQINEEDGQKLDSALASAFKVLKENRQNKKKKQGKTAQALTHFRVRVVDLIQIYLESNPSMVLVLDTILPLIALLEFSIKDQHQKPLQDRIRSCLKRLSNIKKFSDTENVGNDSLTEILKSLIDKGSKSASVYHEMGDKLTECCTFIVRCSQQIDEEDDKSIENIYAEILETFFKKRDCVLPPMMFKSVLNLQWNGNWKLVPLLIEFAFDNTIRPFRRNQALEFLDTFYHNNRLIQADECYLEIRKIFEENISVKSVKLLNEIGQKNSKEGITQGIKQKFVCLLLTLLYTIKHHTQSNNCHWKSIADAMTRYRANNSSLARDARTAYNRLAQQLGISINPLATSNKKNNEAKQLTENGDEHFESNGKAVEEGEEEEEEKGESIHDDESEEDSELKNKQTKKEKKKKQKSKSKQKDKQQLKKETRELRMKAMSDGLVDTVNFSSVPINYVDDTEMETADTELNLQKNGETILPVKNSNNDKKNINKESKLNRKVSPRKRLASETRADSPLKLSKKKK